MRNLNLKSAYVKLVAAAAVLPLAMTSLLALPATATATEESQDSESTYAELSENTNGGDAFGGDAFYRQIDEEADDSESGTQEESIDFPAQLSVDETQEPELAGTSAVQVPEQDAPIAASTGLSEIEPCAAASCATRVGLGQTISGTAFTTTSAWDNDYFVFDVPSDGRLNLDFTFPKGLGSGSAYELSVLNSAGKRVYFYEVRASDWDGNKLKAAAMYVSAGTWYVRINGYRGDAIWEQPYKLTPSVTAGRVEREFNDSTAAATSLGLGQTILGASNIATSAWDNDYFVFDVPSDGRLNLDFTFPKGLGSGSAYELSVLNSAGKRVYFYEVRASDWDGNKLKAAAMYVSAGTWYVRVNGYSGDATWRQPYKLTPSVTAGRVEREFNDSTAAATSLGLGQTILGASNIATSAWDNDYFVFDVPSDGRLNLDFTFPKGLGSGSAYELSVLNSAGKRVYFYEVRASDWDGNKLKAAQMTFQRGTWYVRVNGYSGDATWRQPYKLTIRKPSIPVSATPTISGTAKVGSVLTAKPGTWTSGTTFKYQWLADGTAISGATKATYTPVAAQVGKTLTVKVTGSKSGYTSVSKTSAKTKAVVKGTLTTATPTISGTAKVGVALTAKPGTWTSGTAFKYQWLVNGTAISGATKATYTPAAAQVGKTLTVKVTGSKSGYTSVSKTSAKTKAVVKGTLTTATPTISGTAKVGVALTAKPGTWTSGTAFKYQWLVNGTAISGATSATYKPVAAQVGKTLTVKVTGSKSGYTSVAKTSAKTKTVAKATPSVASATPTVSGAAKVGSTLTAKPGTWTSGTAFKYQWLADGTAISGATSATYKPVAAQVGKTLTVKVTGSKSGYTSVSKTSAKTKAVVKGTLTTATPTISGTAKVGVALTAKPGTWTSGTTFKYQWLADGTAISGATSATYKPVAAQVGKTLTVKVTGSKSGYTSVSKTSAKTAAVAKGTLVAATPTISGTAKVGSTLTAKPGTWTSGTAFKYQWLVNGTAISGATSATYKPVAAQVGKTLTVKVTGSKSGYTSVSKTSGKTKAVVAAAPATLSSATPTITGSLKVGSALTANPGTWTSGTSFSYQWYRNGAAIPGATGSTYVPTNADALRSFSVSVTGAKSGFTSATTWSGGTDVLRNLGDSLVPGGRMPVDTYLESSTGSHRLWVQSDGNLVLYNQSSGRAIWAVNKYGSDASLEFQHDGNVVLYSSGGAKFATNTVGKGSSFFALQSDGNLVLYAGSRALWATGTNGR